MSFYQQKENFKEPPLLSVHMITYNHEPFIGQAIEGVLFQKTDFKIELVIGEDCSTDLTRTICESYARRFPDVIKILPSEKNLGMMLNGNRTSLACSGKYIATCEGDDYWTDPLKLQKQVDFLELNQEYVFTFHDCIILNQKTGESKLRIGSRKIDYIVDLKSLIIQNNIPTASLVFRNILDYSSLPTWITDITKGDYCLSIFLAENGLGKYFPEQMSVYRVHDGGVWSSNGFEFAHNADLSFYNYLLGYFDNQGLKKTIRAKLKWTRFNYGISNIREGFIIKGLFLAVTNLRFKGDPRLRTSPRKIASAIKSALKRDQKI